MHPWMIEPATESRSGSCPELRFLHLCPWTALQDTTVGRSALDTSTGGGPKSAAVFPGRPLNRSTTLNDTRKYWLSSDMLTLVIVVKRPKTSSVRTVTFYAHPSGLSGAMDRYPVDISSL